MPEFFLELFSEEIPAGVQATATSELFGICENVFAQLAMRSARGFYGPRRIAIAATINAERPGKTEEIRGPRESAPEAALKGFLNKHRATAADVIRHEGYYVLKIQDEKTSAKDVIRQDLALALAKLKWRKSMRWEESGSFSWIRPLRRMVCLLDSEIIPIKLASIVAGNQTEGHRSVCGGPIIVSSAVDWQRKLETHRVVVDFDERQHRIERGFQENLHELGLTLVDDDDLMVEVSGLVEWPVPLIGKIDDQFMELPPEVRELSMKENQKYFATRDAEGAPAPYFAFVANLDAPDGGHAIIAGNERVLRARLSDARYFWEIDLKTPLDALLPKLEKITFHTKIGTQRERADRIAEKSYGIAILLQPDVDTSIKMRLAETAKWAGLLCKTDLVTGMVKEFPELQGTVGGYYAELASNGWDGTKVGKAIATHYQPKGPSDDVPEGLIAVSVALADKIDTLVEFFKINEKPTGSGDPYALRRAALGVVRIIRDNSLRLPLKTIIHNDLALFDFIVERLRILLRSEGKRHDVLNAVFAAGQDDDLLRLLTKTSVLTAMLQLDNGTNLVGGYRRAANILKVEESKSETFVGQPDPTLFEYDEERAFFDKLTFAAPVIDYHLLTENYPKAMIELAQLRPAVDAFFEKVRVNADRPDLKRNRLKLLALFRDTVHQIADFSKLEG